MLILSYRGSIFMCKAVSLLYKYLSIDNTDNSAVNPIDIVSFERHVVVLAVFGCNTNNYMTHRQTLPRGAELNWS